MMHRPHGDREYSDGRRADHSREQSEEGHGRRRSRSPDRKRRRVADERRRSASPDTDARDSRHHRHHHRRHHHHRRGKTRDDTGNAAEDAQLPFSSRRLGKSDLQTFEPLFVYYLAVQKQKEAEDMDEREFKGRWKSFVGKWNRGELAEGWYDPDMFARVAALGPARGPAPAGEDEPAPHARRRRSTEEMDDYEAASRRAGGAGDVDDDEDDDYGPILPQADARRPVGAQIPSLQDLSLRNELIEESRAADRESLRAERKADRALQKERLEDLAPRAEAGTRERRLEKRREVNDKMRQFRDKSPGGDGGGDNEQEEAMGGGDSLEEYKRAKEREQKRKSERQIRREEMERARREEMEERRRAWQEREDGTVTMLKELARQRFG
ncbi:hypothetical protein ACCO45_009206 [Purpureocillium lilacinum]|uniref:Uncharacterized protein n=1 Tax=Purpureocillium lilacinum TaxID=33203 RepID=A0ACC4DM16_PURLI